MAKNSSKSESGKAPSPESQGQKQSDQSQPTRPEVPDTSSPAVLTQAPPPRPEPPVKDIPEHAQRHLDDTDVELPEALGVTEGMREPTIRPSDLPKTDREGQPIDQFTFRRERGIPNPKRLYRVTAIKKNTNIEPMEVEAVDESEAIAIFLRTLRIKKSYQFRFQVICLEE